MLLLLFWHSADTLWAVEHSFKSLEKNTTEDFQTEADIAPVLALLQLSKPDFAEVSPKDKV